MSGTDWRRSPAINRLKNATIALCLLAPSLWMIATVPPLWRDVDGYNQLTQDPLLSTFWGWGPAYGYLAKVPLLVTEQVQRLAGPGPHHTTSSIALTDAGIASLIITQHIALGIAAFGFIRAITGIFWLRVVLAMVWASNALFYTFAHSIGSESLSVILLIVLVTQAVRLLRSQPELRWREWYGSAVALWLCLLTRQINGLLVFLLPTAFLVAWIQLRFSKSVASPRKQLLQNAVIAAAIGIGCIVMAGSLTQRLAAKTRLHPHSRIGFTFLWRLQFLKTMPPTARDALLHDAGQRVRSEDARQLLHLLSQTHKEGADPVTSFLPRAAATLFPGQPVVPWERLDTALNEIAYAFLLPPRGELLQAATSDFAQTSRMPVTDITDHLFEMTTYFFQHRDEMPGCAGLVTFRDYDTETISRLPFNLPYFHLWRGLNYNEVIAIWVVTWSTLVGIGYWKTINTAPGTGLGLALVATGTLMVAVTCLLTESLPRYAVPMWELLLLSWFFVVGQIGEIFRSPPLVTPVAG
jgi:hypothetical protein